MALSPSFVRSLLVAAVGIVVSGLYKGYRQRRLFRRTIEVYGGPVLPGHSWISGHLIPVGKVLAKQPINVHGQNVFYCIALEYPELMSAGAIYLDLWPFASPTLATFHPELTSQYTQDQSMPKHDVYATEFYWFSGLKDLVTSDGAHWKKWRSAFNPGFSSQNVMALVPSFVQEALVWKEYLLKVARTGETIQLEDSTMLATCDIISRSVLGASAGIQKGNNRIWRALKKNIGLVYPDWSPASLPKALNPLRIPLHMYYNHVLRQELLPLIQAQMKQEEDVSSGPKTIVNLALRTHRKDSGAVTEAERRKLEKEFIDITVEQMKIFLFAGHDTTSSTLCFTYAELHDHPEVLTKVRAEHDAVFGDDPTTTAQQIADNPILLNQLPYTFAVLKEILRMYSPVGTVRASRADVFLSDPTVPGRRLPTNGFMLHDCNQALHRNPAIWSRPDDFVPERWLGGEAEKLPRNVFRTFALGPRNCIGQELAMTELKMLLAMTVRELDILPAYEEDDPVSLGRKAFQAHMPNEVTAHPSKGLPVTLRLRTSATA